MSKAALLIGTPATLSRLERQLDLMGAARPVTLGWVLIDAADACEGAPILGIERELEAIVARRRPPLAIVCLPAVMTDLIRSLRTRLRRLGVADRFVPTLEDQIAGIGPRTELDLDPTTLLGRPLRGGTGESIASVVRSRRVLITGAGGSIGGELARLVAAHGPEQLVLVERSENALFEIDRQIARRHPALPRLAVLHDVVDAAGTRACCMAQRPELVIHAAAHKHVPMMEDHPAAAVDNNFFGTVAIADAANECGAERFVMISSDKAVNPTSIMGATKRLAELYVQDINRRSETAFAMVRFGNVLGSAGSVLETWARQIADGGPLTVTDPRMTRYFMTIPEAAALVLEAAGLVNPAVETGEVFLLDMGEPVRIVDLAERFIRLHGLEPRLPDAAALDAAEDGRGTMRVAYTGVRPGEKLHEELVLDVECMQPTEHPAIKRWLLPPPRAGLGDDLRERLAAVRGACEHAAVVAAIRQALPEMGRVAA